MDLTEADILRSGGKNTQNWTWKKKKKEEEEEDLNDPHNCEHALLTQNQASWNVKSRSP